MAAEMGHLLLIIIILCMSKLTKCITDSEVVKTSISCGDDFCNKVTLKIETKDKTYELHLVKNNYLFSSAYKSSESNSRTDPNLLNCYYNLNKQESPGKWASISTCHNQLNGAFSIGDGEAFEMKVDSNTNQTVLYDVSKLSDASSCGVSGDDFVPPEPESRQFQVAGDLPKIYIKVLLVNSYNLYAKYYKSSIEDLTAHDHRLISQVTSIFEPLRVHIILVGIETWKDKEQIATNLDRHGTLDQFGNYAAANYHDRYKYDVALFYFGHTWPSGSNGIATSGVICEKSLFSRRAAITALDGLLQLRPEVGVAMTMAHEIAHVIGLGHLNLTANPHCECPGQHYCMMSPQKDNTLTTWSECTKTALRTIHEKGDTKCVMAKPYDPIHSQSICGNGVLEAGEQCDCDHGDTACRICCEVTTCTFTAGSNCASGECCVSCKLKRQGSQCSNLGADQQCVLPTVCDGKSPVCPLDTNLPDLTNCRDRSFDGNCFKGRCVSRGGHCQDIWGSLVTPSAEVAYTEWNKEGDEYGHCGKDHKHMVPCDAADVLCGTSKCDVEDYTANEEALKRAAVSKGGLTWRILQDVSKVPEVFTLTATYFSSSFHLNPEGLKCGTEKVCSNVKCIPVGCQENCNDQGRCVNGKCVCNSGFDGPFCSKPCPSNCNRHGFCRKDGTCDCLEGFVPPNCTPPKTIITSTTRTTTSSTARVTSTTRKTTTKRIITTTTKGTTTRKTTTTTRKPIPPIITSKPTTTRKPSIRPTPTSQAPISSNSPRTTKDSKSQTHSTKVLPSQLTDKTKIIIAVIGVVLIVLCILICLSSSGQDPKTVSFASALESSNLETSTNMRLTLDEEMQPIK